MRRAVAFAATTLLTIAAMTACSTTIQFAGVRGEGPLTREVRDVPAFEGVSAGGGINLQIEIGDVQSVELEAEANILEILDTVVGDDGYLRIDASDSYSSGKGVTARIVVPRLAGVTLSGGASGEIDGLDAAELELDASGGASLTVHGSVQHLRLGLEGGASAHLDDLSAEEVDLDVSGGSDAQLSVSASVHGEVSGGSSVHVDGDAELHVTESGGGSVD